MANRAIVVLASALLLAASSYDGPLAFIADQWYFEVKYGFYSEARLPGSTIWKLTVRDVRRSKVGADGRVEGEPLPDWVPRTKVSWNESRTLMLASFGEHAVVLSPDYQIEKVYRNVSVAKWLNDSEIGAEVEIGSPVSKYDVAGFAINVHTDAWRRLK